MNDIEARLDSIEKGNQEHFVANGDQYAYYLIEDIGWLINIVKKLRSVLILWRYETQGEMIACREGLMDSQKLYLTIHKLLLITKEAMEGLE